MADWYEMIRVIKKAAMEAFTASHPCDFLFGKVVELEKNLQGEVIKLVIQVDSKLKIELEFLTFGQSVPRNSITEGEELILLKQSGGQLFYVMDRRDTDVAE